MRHEYDGHPKGAYEHLDIGEQFSPQDGVHGGKGLVQENDARA
jgi:hypothetical protein